MQWIFSSDICHSPRSSLYYSMDFILFMLNKGRSAIEHTTQNQVQIVHVIKFNEISQVTLATHFAHLLITAWILFYLYQDDGRGNRTYYTKSGANCSCDKMQWSFPSDISHSLRSSPYYSMDFILFMLNEERGAIEHTTQNQVHINCVIKCNEFSQVTSATHLAHRLITAWILFHLCQDEGRGQ